MLGIFDSGVGGLTVVRELLERHPRASFVYLGDTARTPYGNKSPENIIRYSLEDAAYLISQGATALIVACNTASSYAIHDLKKHFPGFPVFEVISPAVTNALAVTHGKIGVIGTNATIRANIYRDRLCRDSDVEVNQVACPLLVPLVEEGWIENEETRSVIAHYLGPLKRHGIDTLILGCTHYPLLKKQIASFMGPDVTIIDSASSLIAEIERLAPELLTDHGRSSQRFCFTDDNSNTPSIVQSWLTRAVHCEVVRTPVLRGNV